MRARNVRHGAEAARMGAQDAGRRADATAGRAAALLRDAGRLAEAAAAAAATTGGGRAGTDSGPRRLPLELSRVWEDAEQSRQILEADAAAAEESVRSAASLRAAMMLWMVLGASNAGLDEADGGGLEGKCDPSAKRAAAAWARARAAACRANATYPAHV